MASNVVSANINNQHRDILIVGAGLSGISAAWHIQKHCPEKSWTIVEARDALGGTWDLFRYPGIRSDSDMFTLGYSFKPWKNPKAIADGPSILEYIRETAQENGIDKNIQYNHKVKNASWSSDDALWTVEMQAPEGSTVTMTCNYIYMCTGYYNLEEGYTPQWEGMGQYQGQIVHPQHWPENLDYTNKKVVVIGSGATAVTLIPSMADETAHITMLQRSPTYVVSRPSEDRLANILRKILPAKLAYKIIRWHAISFSTYFYKLSKRKPDGVKLEIIRRIREELGPEFDVERHFFPKYNPWDQRVCMVPDSDMFHKINEGKASIVTDHIETFTPNGLLLKSGKELEADIIVTATGLKLIPLGGLQVSVDGKHVPWESTMLYKGTMYSDLPNLGSAHGYTNASWTLKCDLSAEYFCRLVNYMDDNGYTSCTPRKPSDIQEEAAIDLKSGYVRRAEAQSPKQGNKSPWKLYQNYFKDVKMFRKSELNDGAVEFGRTDNNTKRNISGIAAE